jgi:hypothetical protein
VVADMFEQQKALNATMSAAAAAGRRRGDPQPSVAFAEKLKQERKDELKEVAQSRAGSVAELKSRFKTESAGRSVKFSNPTTSAWLDPKQDEKETAAAPQPQAAEPPSVPPAAVEPAPETSAAATIDTVITISDSGFHTPGYVEEEPPVQEQPSDQTKPSQ